MKKVLWRVCKATGLLVKPANVFLLDHLLGKPLPSSKDGEQKLGSTEGIAVFGLDALGSTAYGPEATLTLLIPLGAGASHAMVAISFCILFLLAIVCFSY